ncbi:hypothetical protein EVAR_48523_1 [Eumeta japonica]|uniref:Pulmonary surfactant-associated protein B n=1 Tax=Eumeta variegata TaxID=151549 RepID=A0A4C1Z5Q5_EUMVA|nr:hypothetical protein EVAR_48523_1 [Eumeta japonica]
MTHTYHDEIEASECGAVGHCTTTVWEKTQENISKNDISDKFVRLFRQLKDVKDLINEDYLSARVHSACRDIPYPAARTICNSNTAHLEQYIFHVLASETSPETMCKVIGMCNNMKLDKVITLSKKKATSTLKPDKQKETLLGASRCTWGPSYWCSNFSTGHECKATHHCIQRVWSKMEVPEDNDDICKICTDMVQQARDQLQSNETQEELKEVFEGSCKLIPIKAVAKECIKLADEFVPELVETLASQMNPQVVCSVAGLCNNANIDRLLEEYKTQLQLKQDCDNCHQTVTVLKRNFDSATYEDVLVGMLKMCRNTGSLSDSCSMLVFKYYEDILTTVKQYLEPQGVCHLSGQCAVNYHLHDDFIFPNETHIEMNVQSDVPCEFCEQLVKHLRDVLITNTTEEEFYKVLKGLCNQTGKFKEECLEVVGNYYPLIYNYLVSDLDAHEVCALAGICPRNSQVGVPIAPLLPEELIIKSIPLVSKIDSEEKQNFKTIKLVTTYSERGISKMRELYFLGLISPPFRAGPCRLSADKVMRRTPHPHLPPNPPITSHEARTQTPAISNGTSTCSRVVNDRTRGFRGLEAPPPLPVERMFVNLPEGKNMCEFCQYFLHYLQVELSDTNNEERIKEVVEKACDHLPNSINGECKQFVSSYGPAVIALLVQEIDPASVCPALGLCPNTSEVRRVAINSDKSNCPLCLFAVEQLETVLKNNRTEENIRHALENLCTHLSQKLRTECTDFVDTYSKQLIEMLVADMNAQEICVYLKLCKDEIPDLLKIVTTTSESPIDKYHNHPQLRGDRNNYRKPMLPKKMLQNTGFGDIETNEIPDNTAGGRPIKPFGQKTVCVICEFVMKEIDDEIKDKHNEDEIKRIVHNVCNHMPKSVRANCDQFVDKYADLIISLLAQELDPAEVCEELKLCDPELLQNIDVHKIKEEILDCAVCETVVMAVQKVLSNDKVDRNIVHIVEKSCNLLPARYYDRCHTLMEIYGDSVIHLIEELGTKGVCQKIGLCTGQPGAYVRMYKGRHN